MAVIEVDGLVERYGDHIAVDDVSFTVRRGEVGVVGRNGAGKTATVEWLEGPIASRGWPTSASATDRRCCPDVRASRLDRTVIVGEPDPWAITTPA